ncbi:hypothetical protein Pcac1_g12302 [Phytophthora cactorum]|uniref:Reverse transcriptase n=2 Tax=Phytophthora cactorum TaxID=29920 RepID=A0A8T1FUV8_9STRA|nr:hypothetical protein Pcac1_g12302 [Phytophthora cactorum]KAG2913366.1 hypothetical protein PC115_g12080 [Phytophthora cactorum]KAG2979984.1 hypothetical protein PC118_g11454 [Phytophthora cactorum]
MKVRSKRENSLRALVDSGASSNFVRQQSLPKLNFEDVDTPRSVLEVRLATGATVRIEKRVVRVLFSYKLRVFVKNLIVSDLDDKFDLMLSILWLARHYPVVNWEKRTLVRFGRNATESDGPVSVAHAPQGSSDHTVETAPCVAASGAHTQVTTSEAVVESVSNQKSDLRCIPTSMRVSTLGIDRLSMEETSATSSSCKVGVSAPGVDTEGSAARRRGVKSASTPGVDDAASSVGGCKRPTPGKLACSRAAGLHEEAICNQAGLDCVRPRKESTDGYDNGNPSKAGPGQGTSGAGLHKKKRRRKQHKLCKYRPGTETLQEMSAGQTSDTTSSVETFNVLTRTRTGLQYRSMHLENPPTSASELTSLPAMSWMRFAKDLYDGRIEQICILSNLERMKSEVEELRQLHAASTTESEDTLRAKTKKERFDGQSWDSPSASPFYDVLREHKDVLPDEIPSELPQDKEIQHEIDLVPGTKYCVTRQWPLPRDQVKAIDDFFESRRQAGQVRESKSPHSAPTSCVKKPQGGWRIVHAYHKLNDAAIPAQTPIPRKM